MPDAPANSTAFGDPRECEQESGDKRAADCGARSGRPDRHRLYDRHDVQHCQLPLVPFRQAGRLGQRTLGQLGTTNGAHDVQNGRHRQESFSLDVPPRAVRRCA